MARGDIPEKRVEVREFERVVRHLKAQGAPDYQDDVTREDGDDGPGADGPLFEGAAGGGDAVYNQAIQDARGFLQDKLHDLEAEFYEPDEPPRDRS